MSKAQYRKESGFVPGIGPLQAPNATAAADGFYVSYNDGDVGLYGCDTTALVIGQMEAFYILNGDHRESYAPLIEEGLDACLGYFRDNIGQINFRSERPAAPAPGL